MMATASGAKGLKTEELVRAYFLRAGFFVMRGIKLRHDGVELTDIDMWVYERSATLARRRTIIDIKDKELRRQRNGCSSSREWQASCPSRARPVD
ncbi:MAG: hypothetical protein EOS28_29900 [Mesorhizobium sp.]|uniref:hypothetical protein n=1 Tax=Mesorhizobium sp. TaxID=1871066 RepID=UPI000FE72758|nr:hypothetical protein [Mesorhizobium sp.]RWC38432.1 MAG: hypothetical protein EOS28_29900 [Mesorhizobium sp.]